MSKPISLCDTAGMTNERWLECRMHGPKGDIPYTVGGSDVAAIFGVSPWTTPMELWLIKKGRMKPAAKSNSNQLMMGHLLEPIAAYWYGQKTGNTVTEDTHLYQHADHPYALANFDRRFTRKSDVGREFWSAKAVPIIRQMNGQTMRFRCIMNFSSVFISQWQMSISVLFQQSGAITRTMIWRFRILSATRRKRI